MSNTEQRTHPDIFIPAMDYDRLLAMAEGAVRRDPDAANFLMHELGRASTKAPGPEEDVVRMQSHVRFRDESTGRIREVELVHPERVDPAAGRISILTPVGTALIGMSKGQSTEWKDRSGNRKCLTVLGVRNVSQASA